MGAKKLALDLKIGFQENAKSKQLILFYILCRNQQSVANLTGKLKRMKSCKKFPWEKCWLNYTVILEGIYMTLSTLFISIRTG